LCLSGNGAGHSGFQVGGQAVIEGVMMRSPDAVAVAVRRSDGHILVKRSPFRSWTKRIRLLGWPFLRGGIILIESLVLGVQALNFSSEIAMESLQGDKKRPRRKSDGWILAGTAVFAFALGLLLFFYLPLLITGWTGVQNGIGFNLIDGAIRLAVFIGYLFLIRLWKDIRRIFEYHGAEHKSIFAFEAGQPLEAEAVQRFSTHHPRCGTSFLLVVMLVSVLVFMFLGRPQTFTDRIVRFLFIPVIGGVSYEIIRLSTKRFGRWLAHSLVAPGVWLQHLTTGEPDRGQLEVALVALKAALNRDVDGPGIVAWHPDEAGAAKSSRPAERP
jgi:uncharacterized protein YqhQ